MNKLGFLLGIFSLVSDCSSQIYENATHGPRKIYLTIDDAPSCHMKKKIDFLYEHTIPAIFYCRGNAILEHTEYVIQAIQKGFLIGNHSFSHPFFSQISLDECYQEILKTEELIEECYKNAGMQRPAKVIRLPYGDRGAGDFARMPQTEEEKKKVEAIQNFLAAQGFSKIHFQDFTDDAIDAFWTWDSQDYKKSLIEDADAYMKKFQDHFYESHREIEILLLHDFDSNHHLFEQAMEFLQTKKVEFLEFQ